MSNTDNSVKSAEEILIYELTKHQYKIVENTVNLKQFILDAMQAYAQQEREIAVEKALTDLRLEMVSKMPEFSPFEKSGTKKHAEWIGFGNAITALDNYILSLKPQIIEQLNK